jgi:hypothetical protein
MRKLFSKKDNFNVVSDSILTIGRVCRIVYGMEFNGFLGRLFAPQCLNRRDSFSEIFCQAALWVIALRSVVDQ